MLSIVEAAKAIGGTRQQLYNVINGRREMAVRFDVRFENAFDDGADLWLRMQAARGLATVRHSEEESEYDALRGRYDGSHFRPALVDRVSIARQLGCLLL